MQKYACEAANQRLNDKPVSNLGTHEEVTFIAVRRRVDRIWHAQDKRMPVVNLRKNESP
ncbi:hypothetical protein SBV1_1330021 [Verrucomicrobia bacterium]|nr:hypothetical protein SBV1_1330021 [Verrucomicrobiota bacterium]